MKKIIFLPVLFFLLFITAKAQTPTFQWAKSLGGSASDFSGPIFTDASGNVFTAGYFGGTADFDPGPGVTNLTSLGSNDIFISKLDASGNYAWVKQIGGTLQETCGGMRTDASGNIYLCGNFRQVVDFDPGAGTFTMGTTASTFAILFVLKLDAGGNLLWAKQVGTGTAAGPNGVDLAVDATGNVHVTGNFNGTFDFDPGSGVSNLSTTSQTGFVLKLDASGNFVWAEVLGGNGGMTIDLDASGNVYTGGYFTTTVDFDQGPGTTALTSMGQIDGFVCKYSSAGSFVWVKQLGGNVADLVVALMVDSQGNVYSTGTFNGLFYPDPAIATTTFACFGQTDIFVSKLDASGNYIWGKQLGGTYAELVNDLYVDQANDVYITGSFAGGSLGGGTADFDPGPATFNLTNTGANDLFYSKLSSGGNFSWACGSGTTSGEGGYGIYVDATCGVYVTGTYASTVDFDPFTPISNLTSAGFSDGVIIKLAQSAASPTNTSGDIKFCSGKTATLTATGPSNINWFDSFTATTSVATGTMYVTPALTVNTTYYIGSSFCGVNSALIPITITVNPSPTVTIVASKTMVCVGNPVTFTAGGATQYSWTSGSTLQVTSATVQANTTYTYGVTGTDANNCKNTASISISTSKCTGVQELNKETDFMVYPNPSSNGFYIRSEQPLLVSIYNCIGQVIGQMNLDPNNSGTWIDLKPGVYFIVSDKNALCKKIIISDR